MEVLPKAISRSRISSTHSLQKREESQESALEFPKDRVDLARHQRPVVLLHGTIVGKEGIEAYREFALQQGHPVNHRDYPGITKGAAIEQSTEIASKEVNRSRAEVARLNLENLKNADSQRLEQFFQLDGGLYGTPDADADKIGALLPTVTSRVASLLNQPQSMIESSLSGQLRELEQELAGELGKQGVSSPHLVKIAAGLVDALAPKAILVGHSAGGFVAQTMVVNPEPEVGIDLPFAYDGGHGVGEAILLSAPVGKGLPTPAPPGVLGLPYYNYESQVLRPLEKLPQVQLARLNPIADFMYGATKAWLSMASEVGTYVSLSMTSPLLHIASPGYRQVNEGDEFFETYVKDKPVPDGVSVLAVTSPLDQLSQEDRSKVTTGQVNAHHLSIDLGVSDEDIRRERPTWSHVIMTEKPDSFKAQYAEHLSHNSDAFGKLLDPKNDDGVRYEALRLLKGELADDPGLIERQPGVGQVLAKVAAERMPFEDSPSYLAFQMLQTK
jgi:Alpha/beta hydrolase family